MDALLLAAGSGIASVFTLIGFVIGRVGRRTDAPLSYRCSCRHQLSYHDPQTGRCNYVKVKVYDVDEPCTCRTYVGERPPVEVDPDYVLRQLRGTDT